MSGFSCARCVTPAKCALYGCCPGTWPAEAVAEIERRDPLIVGDRLSGATARLMAALHVERVCEDERDKAEPRMLPAFEDALTQAHEQTRIAWKECVVALEGWAALRMEPPANAKVSGSDGAAG